MPSAIQAFGTESALLLIQAAAAHGGAGAPSRLWFVTAGSQAVDGTETPRIEQAPVAGLARVAASNTPSCASPTSTSTRRAGDQRADARQLADGCPTRRALPTTAITRAGSRCARRAPMVARLARHQRRVRCAHRRCTGAAAHRTSAARWRTSRSLPASGAPPGPREIEIRVRASGLNFRDVLSALNLYPGEIRHLGSDCAGEIVALGSKASTASLLATASSRWSKARSPATPPRAGSSSRRCRRGSTSSSAQRSRPPTSLPTSRSTRSPRHQGRRSVC